MPPIPIRWRSASPSNPRNNVASVDSLNYSDAGSASLCSTATILNLLYFTQSNIADRKV